MLAAFKAKKSKLLNKTAAAKDEANNNQSSCENNDRIKKTSGGGGGGGGSIQKAYAKFVTATTRRFKEEENETATSVDNNNSNNNQDEQLPPTPLSPDAMMVNSYEDLIAGKVNEPPHHLKKSESFSFLQTRDSKTGGFPISERIRNTFKSSLSLSSSAQHQIDTPWGAGTLVAQHDSCRQVLVPSVGNLTAYIAAEPDRRGRSRGLGRPMLFSTTSLRRLASSVVSKLSIIQHRSEKLPELVIHTPFGLGFVIERNEDHCLVVLKSHPDTVASVALECCKPVVRCTVATPFGPGECVSIDMTTKTVCIQVLSNVLFYVALTEASEYRYEWSKSSSRGFIF